MKTVTIFGSSLPGEGSEAYEEARHLGRRLAESGFVLCNGGYRGLMEASARGAREAGGHTVGVTCAIWPARANPWIEEEVRTASFLERLLTLIERGDAYIVLPGGTGTLAELALVWEMMNKSSLAKTVGGRKPLLVLGSYWHPVIDCLEKEGALGRLENASMEATRRTMEIVTLVPSAEAAVEFLRQQL
jgi:uncharacterized protein (TIGR00730 family)